MNVEPLDVVVIAAGLISVAATLATWRRTDPRWLRWYDDPNLPCWMRHSGLFSIPAGIGVAFLGIGNVLLGAGDRWAVAGFVAGMLFSICVLLIAVISWFGPAWSKPAWLRDRDQRQPPPRSSGFGDGLMVLLVGTASVIGLLGFLAAALSRPG